MPDIEPLHGQPRIAPEPVWVDLSRLDKDALGTLVTGAQCIAESALPPGRSGFERIALLSREAPHLRPLAFEALLHLQLACMIEARLGILGSNAVQTSPRMIRIPTSGIPEMSHAVFSSCAYLRPFRSPRMITDGRSLIAQSIEQIPAPLVADPLSAHAMRFGLDEMRAWLHVLANSPQATDPVEGGACHFSEIAAFPQVLLDRLTILLLSCECIQGAYLLQVRPLESQERFRVALLIKCDEYATSATLERVRSALPLLGFGLDEDAAPQCALLLDQYPGFAREVLTHLRPIYDRALARWLAHPAETKQRPHEA
jgi:hypothetical protein